MPEGSETCIHHLRFFWCWAVLCLIVAACAGVATVTLGDRQRFPDCSTALGCEQRSIPASRHRAQGLGDAGAASGRRRRSHRAAASPRRRRALPATCHRKRKPRTPRSADSGDKIKMHHFSCRSLELTRLTKMGRSLFFCNVGGAARDLKNCFSETEQLVSGKVQHQQCAAS